MIPLYGRAVQARIPRSVLRDEKAVEIVARLDYDFAKFDGGPSLRGSVLRTCILDDWTVEFLAAHPYGCVVELGAGLSSRFDRLDNGTCRWFDLDLPEVIALRRTFFTDTERYRMHAADLTDLSWLDIAAEAAGPHLILAEGVLVYLDEVEVLRVLAEVARRFRGGVFALDTCGRPMVDRRDRHDSVSQRAARVRWACADPAGLHVSGLRLRESRTLAEPPRSVRTRLSYRARLRLAVAARFNLRDFARYRVNLYDLQPDGPR